MTLQAVTTQGNDAQTSGLALKELQGLRISYVAGAATTTAMAVAALRKTDTLLSVLVLSSTAAGAFADDTANVTVQETKATGTLTVSGNPVDAETFVVGDNTYTWKTTPTAINHVKIVAGDNNAMAANVAAAINSVENKRATVGNQQPPNVVATVNNAIVTITSTTDGVGNGIVISSSDGTDLAVAGTTTASATVTAAAVDNDDNVTVNGVTFTAKAAPSGYQQFLTINGDNTAQALAIAKAINDYERVYGTLGVTASALAAVVTIVPKYRKTGNITVLTEAATNFAASGSGTLAGGTATGGIKSSTDLSNKSVLVFWFKKATA